MSSSRECSPRTSSPRNSSVSRSIMSNPNDEVRFDNNGAIDNEKRDQTAKSSLVADAEIGSLSISVSHILFPKQSLFIPQRRILNSGN